MNLIAFSMKTKGLRNFARRLWTVFTRFGFTETRTRTALYALINLLHDHHAAPTFFIPAVVLQRHPALLAAIVEAGAEVGIHGYVHNDYRTLSAIEQYGQTRQAIEVFQAKRIPYQGFRNPYLGWTEQSLSVFSSLGMGYESNEAVIHDVIDRTKFSPLQQGGFEKSLQLFQAINPCKYTLRPHFEGSLLRLPTSIPDDEMLFDRLRITDPAEIGRIWSQIMQRVYDYGGVYILNLHPERGILCRQALATLLDYACNRPQPIWITRLDEIANWWRERSRFKLHITPIAPQRWRVEADCTSRGGLLARHLTIEDTAIVEGPMHCPTTCIVQAERYPGVGLSPRTPPQITTLLAEQGYAHTTASPEQADHFSLYLDLPEGLGETRAEQQARCGALIRQIERLDAPLLSFRCWPNDYQAALAISGDIDSVTIQDFFLRILEVSSAKVPYVKTSHAIDNQEHLA